MVVRQAGIPHVMSGVTVEGLKEIEGDLADVAGGLTDLDFGPLAQAIATAAQRHAPVRTGRLKASIQPGKRKNTAVVLAGNSRVKYAMVRNYGPGSHRLFLQKGEADVDVTALVESEISNLIVEKGLA